MNDFWMRVRQAWRQAVAVARKELGAYFGSPIALIFVGVFLVATLAVFFWVEAFWSRGIADVRPLFSWMPLLLILLVPALTMRQWSEEEQSGTLEVLLTLPVRHISLVLGKFMAVVALVAVALALTFFLPVTTSILGDLDWGPVLGGYLAALLVAATYAAIGLFVSSRTNNQIVALIVTVLLCGVLYVVGTSLVTGLAGGGGAELLRALGSGSRFESIERGVIDLRDLLYYLSLTAFFLLLNVVSLDSKRWGSGQRTAAYRRNIVLRAALIGANLVALNVWLFPLPMLRADLTADRQYSLSPVTRDLLANLQEPLLLRGYLSKPTHPLLEPLMPTVRDMLNEYEEASPHVVAEVVDPRNNEELETEANQVYGIQPTPFRISGRYEDTVVNSYFDILIRYGDQSVVIGFQELIEVSAGANNQVNVRLRNLEYDLTRAIKKVVYGFQSLDAVFSELDAPVTLTMVVTPDTLPAALQDVPQIVAAAAEDLAAEAGNKFVYGTLDPDEPNSGITRQGLYDTYGIEPFAASLLSDETYYLHLLLQIDDQVQVLYPGSNISEAELRTEIEAALKRTAPGFLKTVGLWTPSEEAVPNPYTGQMEQPISSWQMLRMQLGDNYTVKPVDLSTGRVPGDVDVLVLVAPAGLDDKARFAVDQYLMRGGAVIVAAGNYILSPQQLSGGITVSALEEGLQEMLASYGVEIEAALVMDPQNEPFPIQVPRQVGGMEVVELQQINYPFFVDVRQNLMADDSPIVANLPAVTLQWASPLRIDEQANEGREVTVLLRSTPLSWLRTDVDVNPDMDLYPETGFPVEGERASHPLAVSIRGSFDSYFRDRPSPFEEAAPADGETEPADEGALQPKIDASPESSRLVVIGSAEFLDDIVLEISRAQSQDRFLYNLQLVQNAVDWAVQDEDLLTIRSRGTSARLLQPLERQGQVVWEVINYGVALLGLVAIGVLWYVRRRSEQPAIPVEERARREEKK